MRNWQRSQEARRCAFRILHLSTDRASRHINLDIFGNGWPPKTLPYKGLGAQHTRLNDEARRMAPGEFPERSLAGTNR